MINEFTDIFTFSITLRDVIGNLLAALLCGIIISLVYRHTYKGLNYSSSFAISIIMLTMITSIVIMVIGNNLARAFGMVGAMSIIRFRTAVKDAADIMFIFFALTIGLACGVKMYAVAVFGTLFINAVFIVLHMFNFGMVKRKEYLLQILFAASEVNQEDLDRIIRHFVARYKMVNSRMLGEPGHESMELSYHVFLSDRTKGNVMVSKLKQLPDVKHVNLFYDEN
jgi:uncharacterized membrane protein YhiD involved in acid resistance